MRLWSSNRSRSILSNPFKTEHRASATDAIVNALISQASGGSSPPSAGDLAAVEAAAGLWSRAFASATVLPTTPTTSALSPGILAAIGRGLAVRGDVLFAIDFLDGVVLTQASTWEVRGGTRPETWTYLADFPVPGGVRKRTLPAESVIHLRYATRPGKPWEGVSPLGMASETQALACWLEKRLAQEVSTATAYVLPLPEGRSDSASLKADLKKGGGRLHLVDTMATAWGDGKQSAPAQDWVSKRLGASPPETLGKLRGDVKADIFGAYGIPSSIHGTGGSARESYRQFLSSTIQPLAKIVLEELADKLDTPNLAFDFTELRAADIAGRARAYGVLINAGMPPAEAAEATGLE